MKTPKFAGITPLKVEHYPPGRAAGDFQPGDFILVHGHSLSSWLIRFGEGLRIHGDDRKYTWWNHAALLVSETGELIEATGKGVGTAKLSDYTPDDYQLVHIDASAEDREEAVQFARWAAKHRASYNWTVIASITLSVLTGCKLAFFIDGEFICSGLVARALERTTAVFTLDPVHITPADLAKYYGVPGRQAATRPTPQEAHA